MEEKVIQVCQQIREGNITVSEGALTAQISLSGMNRKLKKYDSLYASGEFSLRQLDLHRESEQVSGGDERYNVYIEENCDDNVDSGSEEMCNDSDEKDDMEDKGEVRNDDSDDEDSDEEDDYSDDDHDEDVGHSVCEAMEFDKYDVTQLSHFLCNVNTITDLVTKIGNHCDTCNGKIIPIKQYVLPRGHIGYTSFFALFKCLTCKCTIEFCPSPLLNGRPISDYLVMHSKLTSGAPFVNVERFTETIGFSSDFNETFNADDFKLDEYCNIVDKMAEESMENARNQVLVEGNKLDGGFDASHQTRKNSANSCVSMISPNTLQVIYSATVTRFEEPISQNHEAVGTRKICDKMKAGGKRIRASSCDGGSATTKVLAEEFPDESLGNLDPYHALKNDTKVIEKCTKGKRSDSGKTWHPELSDKCGPLVKHLRYAISESKITVEQFRDLEQRAEAVKVLKARILIPLSHYQGIHDKCFPSSRCNVDPNYKLSRIKIVHESALTLLERTLTSTVIFRQAHKFLLDFPTSMNESYHSRQNKYFSKRTCMSASMYSMVIGLSILDHNENEEGVFENGKRIEELPLNEEGLPKQPVQSRTFVFNIWKNYMLFRIPQN